MHINFFSSVSRNQKCHSYFNFKTILIILCLAVIVGYLTIIYTKYENNQILDEEEEIYEDDDI